ncbi:hypothetical protein [Paenibacillus pinihumi]|uniref:hypothetical protein n=1 Tax=Paenibacillus pinihumi TaxID=669462 RepID=UPI00040FC294|nr:hypothetical protein [Paenibacillus pinihumi]
MASSKVKETAQQEVEQPVELPPARYVVRQFIQSETYSADRDILTALLDEGQLYTPAEVQAIINKFKNQEAL